MKSTIHIQQMILLPVQCPSTLVINAKKVKKKVHLLSFPRFFIYGYMTVHVQKCCGFLLVLDIKMLDSTTCMHSYFLSTRGYNLFHLHG